MKNVKPILMTAAGVALGIFVYNFSAKMIGQPQFKVGA